MSVAKPAGLSAGEVVSTESSCFDDWQVKIEPWTESCTEEFAKAEAGWAEKVSKYLVISAQYLQCWSYRGTFGCSVQAHRTDLSL